MSDLSLPARIYRRRRSLSEVLLTTSALLISLALMLPILTILGLAFFPTENIWPHLMKTVLAGYVWRTLALMLGVGVLTLLIGTGTAWLITMTRFPFRKVFQWALLVPLALPTYIVAYVYVDFLSYSGPLQTELRTLMGWTSRGDYHFPEIRSLGGAIAIMTLVLYPYVYLTARASFIRQSPDQLEAARALGQSAWGAFLHVGIPLARPAIVVGVSLAVMECLNDVGAMGFFGVRTLTIGIYDTWLAGGNLGGAAQIATVLLVIIFALLWIERSGRRGLASAPGAQRNRAPVRTTLRGWRRYGAFLACFIPVLLGFIVPAILLLDYALRSRGPLFVPGYFLAAGHSLILSLLAAFLAVLLGLALAYANRVSQGFFTRLAIRLANLGYAIPGTVLGIGILIPLAGFDNAFDGVMRRNFNISTGLLLSGSIAAVTYGYLVRFLTISFGTLESGLQRVTPNLEAAARTLGRGPLSTFFDVHLAILRPVIGSAILLVFIDCMKELPATLILRPFDFDTLATKVYTLASLDQLEESALPALTIVGLGLIPVLLLSRSLRDPRLKPRVEAGV